MHIIVRKDALAQGQTHYFTGKPCKYGHIEKRYTSTGQCCTCMDARRDLPKVQEYLQRPEVKAKKRISDRRSYAKCRQARLEAQRQYNSTPERKLRRSKADRAYREANAEALKERKRLYYLRNKTELLEKSAVYVRERARVDVQFRLTRVLRKRTWEALRCQDAAKAARFFELCGCTRIELQAHLESQFLPGMTWDNWTTDGWHVDHIRPCASFDLTDPAQQLQCFHYTNLQPLWAFDNISKSDKWEPATMAA
jgi:hypothetical protein